jgi:hypothetical protein
VVFGVAALVAAACGGGGGGETPDEPAGAVRFGFWGDTPYSGDEARAVVNLVEQMNDAGLDLALFVGDIFGGTCENSGYTEAVETFGSPDVGWVEVVLDPGGATPLLVEPRLVQGTPR